MNCLAKIEGADRARILSVRQMAELLGISVPHLRRLYRLKKVPAPIKVGDRKLGWPFGVASDFLASKNTEVMK